MRRAKMQKRSFCSTNAHCEHGLQCASLQLTISALNVARVDCGTSEVHRGIKFADVVHLANAGTHRPVPEEEEESRLSTHFNKMFSLYFLCNVVFLSVGDPEKIPQNLSNL